MLWMAPKAMQRKPGTLGVVALLADRSTSMAPYMLGETDKALPAFRKAIPGLRVFAFHADLAEVSNGGDLYSASPARGRHKRYGSYTNSTYLGICLEQIARLKPAKTIVISDGGIADMRRALSVADYMTGDIDAYFCASTWQDRGFMEDLARRGGGRFLDFNPDLTDIRAELRRSLSVHITPHITVEHRPPEWRYSGQAVQQRITARPDDVAAVFRKK